MKVYTVAIIQGGDEDVLLVASSIEKAQELAQERAHSKGLHIYRWDSDGMSGYASSVKYVIHEYILDSTNQ